MYNPSTCFHLCLLPACWCVVFCLFCCRFSVFVFCSIVGSLYLFCCCRFTVFVLLLSVLCMFSVVGSLYLLLLSVLSICSVVVGSLYLFCLFCCRFSVFCWFCCCRWRITDWKLPGNDSLLILRSLFLSICTSYCPYFCFYVLSVWLFAICERKKQLMTEHSVRNKYSIVSTSAKHGTH